MITQKMLEAAMVEAVKRGMFPKDAPADQYITAWEDMRAVLEAAQRTADANRVSCPIHGHDWNYMCSMCVAAANASR